MTAPDVATGSNVRRQNAGARFVQMDRTKTYCHVERRRSVTVAAMS